MEGESTTRLFVVAKTILCQSLLPLLYLLMIIVIWQGGSNGAL